MQRKAFRCLSTLYSITTMPKYIIQDESTPLDELRSQLLTQIADEWPDKWAAGHGPAFGCIQDLPSQNAFFEKLVEDMDKVLNQKLGLQSVDYFITKHTLRRFLDPRYKGGFNEKTRNALAMYCGYENWEDFVRLNQSKLIAHTPALVNNFYQLTLLPPGSTLPGSDQKPRPFWYRRSVLLAGVLWLLVITAAGGFALYDYVKSAWVTPNPGQLISDLYDTIRKANEEEFKAYRATPHINLTALESFFEKDASAYANIKQVIERSRDKHRVISNPGNPSTHEILSINLVELNGDQALVKTREYWYLRWFDTQQKEYIDYVYKETNEQYYLMIWREGKWRIKSNAYPPESSNVAQQ